MLQRTTSVLLFSAFLLSACGGGGGGDNPSTASSATFSGTVAIGEPLAGASVVVIHESGAAAFATADAAGRYSVTLSSLPSGFRPLFMIQTHDPAAGVLGQPPAYPRLFSIANRTSGTVNVTPLTSLQVAEKPSRAWKSTCWRAATRRPTSPRSCRSSLMPSARWAVSPIPRF